MNTPQLSETPRTDALAKTIGWCNCEAFKKMRPHANQLEKELNEANRTRQMMASEVSGLLLGLLLHPSHQPLNGFLISEASKAKLLLIKEVIKRYENL